MKSENEIELSICVLESKYHLGNSCGELGRAVASNTIFLIFGKSRFPPKKSFITSTTDIDGLNVEKTAALTT